MPREAHVPEAVIGMRVAGAAAERSSFEGRRRKAVIQIERWFLMGGKDKEDRGSNIALGPVPLPHKNLDSLALPAARFRVHLCPKI